MISWDHEIDEVLNPHLNKVESVGEKQDALALARQIEANDPQVVVTYFDFNAEEGHTQSFWVEPRVNPSTGELYKPGYNQVFVDPLTGRIIGKREWGAVWPITTETFISFLYKLHYSLHIPEFYGTDRWGIWFLGIVAFLWTIDCFTGFYLTLPIQKTSKQDVSLGARLKKYGSRWKTAWKIRRNKGSRILNFDFHRASGLWTWGLLFIIAFTGFSLNLSREIFYPVMTKVSEVTPTPFDSREPTGPLKAITPKISYEEAIKKAKLEAQLLGWSEPASSLWLAREYGMTRIEFSHPNADHGFGGGGHKSILIDSLTGEFLGEWIPWTGTFADLFIQSQFPLHSGRILGLPGRILISLMGLLITALSITGVVIWRQKYKARLLKKASAED